MIKKIIFLTFIFLFSHILEIYAAEQALSPIITAIQNAYGRIRDFSANFEQTLSHKETGDTELRRGEIKFLRPCFIKWHTFKPYDETMVVTNNAIWNYIPDEKIVYKYSPEILKDSHGILQVITGQSVLTKDFLVKNDGMDGSYTKLTLMPQKPTPQMVEGAIWVEPATGVIRKARVIDFYGNTNEIFLNDFNFNCKLQQKDFTFIPPKNIEIEDRTKK